MNCYTFTLKVLKDFNKIKGFLKVLTHCSREIHKRVIGKQRRPRSDAVERSVWSRSPLFANSLDIFVSEYVNLIARHT